MLPFLSSDLFGEEGGPACSERMTNSICRYATHLRQQQSYPIAAATGCRKINLVQISLQLSIEHLLMTWKFWKYWQTSISLISINIFVRLAVLTIRIRIGNVMCGSTDASQHVASVKEVVASRLVLQSGITTV
jgi:hypothetical protein